MIERVVSRGRFVAELESGVHRRGVRAYVSVGAVLLLYGLSTILFVVGAANKATCGEEGPWSPIALVSERSDAVHEQLSWWPLGRQCDWKRADGHGTVTTNSGNLASSSTAYGSLALGLTALWLGIKAEGSRGASRDSNRSSLRTKSAKDRSQL